MKMKVERELSEMRAQLRQGPSGYAIAKTPSDRQKLLVSITQEVRLCVKVCLLTLVLMLCYCSMCAT